LPLAYSAATRLPAEVPVTKSGRMPASFQHLDHADVGKAARGTAAQGQADPGGLFGHGGDRFRRRARHFHLG
jgi:hypothetical protein